MYQRCFDNASETLFVAGKSCWINLAAQFVKKLRRLQIICSDSLSGSADLLRKS